MEKYKIQVLMLLALLGLAACAPHPSSIFSPTKEASSFPWTTATSASTATQRSWPAQRSTATFTPRPSFPFNYEATPTTFPKVEDVVKHARELACDPPCWFGLEPGVSTLQDVLHLWGAWSEVSWTWDAKEHQYGGYLSNPAFYLTFKADRRGRLVYMEVKPKRVLPEYVPANYMQRLGTPPWIVRSFVWRGIGGEEPILDTSALLILYFGYPSRNVVVEMLGFTENLGVDLPTHFQVCIPQSQFSVTYLAYPKQDFRSVRIWRKQDYTDPPALYLTSREEIWKQIIEEKEPFCVEMELEKP